MTVNNSRAGRSGSTDSAKRTGKQAAKKTVGKIAKKLVSWLKKVLWEKPIEYIKLKGKKYLKVAGEKGKQKAKLVRESDVRSKYRTKLSSKLSQWAQSKGDQTQPAGRGDIDSVTSPDIIDELEDVLSRERLRLNRSRSMSL